jgi:hypothetical protein
MDELEKYECFGVPAHVRIPDDVVIVAPSGGSKQRNWIARESAMLGIEAVPSPALAEFQPAK